MWYWRITRRWSSIIVLLATLGIVLTAYCASAQGPALALDISITKEVKEKKGELWIATYVPVEEITIGDVLTYIITYTNKRDAPAVDATIKDMIPEGTVYVMDSATGDNADILYSIDGGNHFQEPPATYIERRPDGTEELREAPPEMFTHIKWLIKTPVLQGSSGQVSFKARVI